MTEQPSSGPSTRVKIALVRRDYREATERDEHPAKVLELLVRTDEPLEKAVLSALAAAREPILGDADSAAVFLARITDESSITNADLHRIDASVRGGVVQWNEYEWASNLATLGEVADARAEGLYPQRFANLAVFPIVDGEWGDAGYAGVPEVGLWLAEHGVGVATWFGQTLLDNLAALGMGYLAGRGVRAQRMRRAVSRWRESSLDRPHALREIVDKRASWDADHLARLLAMHPAEAAQLLRSLGYEKSRDGLWRRRHGRKSRARRAAWIADEMDV